MADNAENGSPQPPGPEMSGSSVGMGGMSMGGGNSGGGGAGAAAAAAAANEHLNIKVTDNNNEVFFKIKRSTKLEKLMTAFCERQGKTPASVRFLFEGQRVQPADTPDTLEMQDGDTLEVHQEQVGGC
jgi:hypothetical protein